MSRLCFISIDGSWFLFITDFAQKADFDENDIRLDGEKLRNSRFLYIMMNKPQGVISASRSDLRNPDEKCVIDLIGEEKHRNLFPVGRLDRDTEGLLLITDDGILAHNLLSPAKHVGKTYYAELRSELSENERLKLEAGVDIGDDTLTLPSKVSKINKTSVHITIHEGRFHQIKRMFEAVSNEVIFLKRLSMGSLRLDDNLKPGEYRELTPEELAALVC